MDYRAIAELVWFALLGISILTLVVGFSVRAFLAPVIRDALGRLRSDADREQQLLGVRMERVEDRLGDLETSLARLAAEEDFHRQLAKPTAEKEEKEEKEGD